MKDDSLHRTLDQALAGLMRMSRDKIRRLSLLDCAFMLDALLVSESSANTCKHLAERLSRQLTPTWISGADLFEVFLVLSALWKYDPLQVSGEHLAYAIQRLIRSEVQVGGPYTCNGVVDIAANLQIACFVQMAAKPLPGLDTFFSQIIAAGHFKDTAQGSPYVLYLLTSLYHCPDVMLLVANYRSETPASRAVALTTMGLSTPVSQQTLLAVCSSQQSTGFWPAEVLISGRPISCVATTALIARSLMEYQSDSNSERNPSGLQQRHQLVVQAAKQLFKNRAEPLRQSTLVAVDKICSSERTFEITLLSYFFDRALKHPSGLTDQQFAMLGAANVCCWVAYSIYDDFLDGEGVVPQLPVANITMRASLDCFRAIPPSRHVFERYVAKIYSEMDEANAWEVNNCRFIVRGSTITIGQLPKYGRQSVLAARSFAHVLGPMAILAKYTKSTPSQIRCIESAFRHYLIARQLSDDLHDWTDDMQAGQASYVVIAIMRDMRLRGGTYNLPVLLSYMQKQFRRTTMPHVCSLALRHISQAKQNFIRSELLQPSNSVYTLLDELELSLRYSLEQHAKAKAFVKTHISYSS